MTIQESLDKIFKEHKVVFWYDEDKALYDHFQSFELDQVSKIEVAQNEFKVKHIILSSSKADKFLLYFSYPEPVYTENWLLDLQLAHKQFSTGQEAMFLQMMGLDYGLKYLVKEHLEFFKSKDRRQKLLDLISHDESEEDIRFKMLAVVFATNYPTLEAYVQSYASALMNENDKIEKELERFNLKDLFWDSISRKFGFKSDDPSIYEFLMDTFSRNFTPTNRGRSVKETRILLSLWKDARSHQESFRMLSERLCDDLLIDKELQALSYNDILNDDLFRLVDLKIISDLSNALTEGIISDDELIRLCKIRKNKYWYSNFHHFYQSLIHASRVFELIDKYSQSSFDSISEACSLYSSSFFKVDFHYRKFFFHYRTSTQNRVFESLKDKVCRRYSNNWLINLNNQLQKLIEKENAWPIKGNHSQLNFFNNHVKQFVDKPQRLFVVISDALRFENGYQLVTDLQSEKRYEAELEYMLTSLPCYTQLGMASLLPHDQLAISSNNCQVEVDGMTSQGTQARSKILKKNSQVRSTAITAENFMKLNASTEGRQFAKDHDLIYIYNNRIDKTGDDKMTEDRVFEAVEEEITYLKEVIRKIANVNGNHIMITSDHGYLYQQEVLDDIDFIESGVKGEIWKENRRFILGKNLSYKDSMHHFTGDQLGYDSGIDVLITKGINRLRIKGAGSRFVHGGASLQEVIVPLIKVSKKREDTTRVVDVDIIKSTDKITTNILAVSFIQKELVTDKVLPRKLRACLMAEDGTILSDYFNYEFDTKDGAERQREVKHRFQLSSVASGKYKNQRISLLLEEPVSGTSSWKQYESYYYTLNISFTNDFDDF